MTTQTQTIKKNNKYLMQAIYPYIHANTWVKVIDVVTNELLENSRKGDSLLHINRQAMNWTIEKSCYNDKTDLCLIYISKGDNYEV